MSEKKLTRQQYLQQKANDLRSIALQYSLSRVNPKTPYIENSETEESFYDNLKKRIIGVQEMIEENKDQVDSDVLEYWNDKIESLQNQKYQKCIPGANCIYTATDNYSLDGVDRRVASNKIFQANPQKYGFLLIEESQLQPGDLVLVLDIKGLFPEHAMIYNRTDEFGNKRYNYSLGHPENTPEQTHPIIKDGLYPTMHETFYTFVGTPDDQRRWSEEYIRKFITPNLKMSNIDIKNNPIQLLNKIDLKANGGNMKKKLIKKAQKGTIFINENDPTKGSWGNRGQGNEIQSALENGLTGMWNGVKWIGDKFINAGDYIDDGIDYLVGFLPGKGLTPEEMVANNQLAREGSLYDINGNYMSTPIILKAPMLPTLPANATPAMQALFNDLKRQRFNWQVRESLLRKIGKADTIETTGTAKVYRRLEAELNKLIDATKGHLNKTDDVKLSKKQNALYKHSKYMASESLGKVGDLRTVNSGRPALKGRQWDEVERVLRTDSNPKAKALLESYDKKVAKGINKEALKVARQKMLEQYLDMMPGYFNYLRK